MPLYFVNGSICRLATRDDMEAALRVTPITQPPFKGPRPKWVRVTGPPNPTSATVGKVYRVLRWDQDAPRFKGDDGSGVWGRWPGEEPQAMNPGWEPASRPTPKRRKASKKGGKRA